MSETGASPLLVLTAYGLLIVLASLAGGWALLAVRPTHTGLQISTSFVAGLMLGVGVLHLLPHSYHQTHSLDRAVAWMMAGFLVVFFIQRFFHFHHHEVSESNGPSAASAPAPCGHEHHDHTHDADPNAPPHPSARRLSWAGASLGLFLHSLLDGVAVAAAVRAESHEGHGLLVGLGPFLVVLLHKPFDAMAVGTLLARGGHSRGFCHLVNGGLALTVPVGILLFHLGLGQTQAVGAFLGATLAFSAGTFLCIAASDLLPELQFHAHDRWKLSVALLAGLGLSALIGHLETTGHDHSGDDDHSPAPALRSHGGENAH